MKFIKACLFVCLLTEPAWCGRILKDSHQQSLTVSPWHLSPLYCLPSNESLEWRSKAVSSEQLNAILHITYLTGLAASQSFSHYRESVHLMLISKRGLTELLSGAVVPFCRGRVVWNCSCQLHFLHVHLLLPLQPCPFPDYPNTLSCDGISKTALHSL